MRPVVFHGAFENAVRLGAQNAAVILEEWVRRRVESGEEKEKERERKNNKKEHKKNT